MAKEKEGTARAHHLLRPHLLGSRCATSTSPSFTSSAETLKELSNRSSRPENSTRQASRCSKCACLSSKSVACFTLFLPPPKLVSQSLFPSQVDIHLHSYLQIPPYIVKAEAALERPQSALLAGNPSIPLSAAQARAREEEATRVEEERKITNTRLQVARALSSLGQGLYEQAARQFLQVKGELGEWAKTVSAKTRLKPSVGPQGHLS
jgi:hypothetical protein